VTALLALLVTGSLGAVGSAWALGRAGRWAQGGAVFGVLALLAVVGLAFAIDPSIEGSTLAPGSGLLDDRLVPNSYLRLVVALWAIDSVLIVLVAWMSGGLVGLRGLLPAMLIALVGGAISFAATDLTLASGAAGATGLAALLVLLTAARPGAVAASARELRASLLGATMLLIVAAAAPVAATLALRSAASTGSAGEAGALVGLLALTVTLAAAVRAGAIPFHVRVPRLTDAAPPFALPLVLAWIPVPLLVVGLTIADRFLVPIALPLQGEHALIVAAALVTLVAASLAAFIQDDLRHATGYLVIADGAFVLLAFAALDPAAWGPARTWLVVLAASKTALVVWAAVMEERFEARSVPDLRGWLRRSPILGAALVVLTLATFGVPGWVAFTARGDLARLAAAWPWDGVLILAGFAALPTYLRLLGLGAGLPTSKVSRAEPERIVRGWRPDALPVEQEGPVLVGRVAPASVAHGAAPVAPMVDERAPRPGTAAGVDDERVPRPGAAGVDDDRSPDPTGTTGPDDPASAGRAADPDRPVEPGRPVERLRRPTAAAGRSALVAAGRGLSAAGSLGRRAATAIRRDRVELTSAVVLALAILAALTSWGALDIASAAAEPAPIVSGPGSD
jgi:formate hydrogenlyase subunit 3/multisubunit Na+/H+ antiporter MnhD subunit